MHRGSCRCRQFPVYAANELERLRAAAYATELVSGSGISGLQTPYDVASMRPHLEKCLEQGAMMPFPRDAMRAHGKRQKVVSVVVDVEVVNVIC